MLRRRAGDISDLSAEDPDGLIEDPRGLRAVKYSCVTAVEAAIDVAQHLCASEQWGSPTTNADAFTILARRGVIDAELATRLAGAVGFRNVLVHEYAVVDDRRVVAALADWTISASSSGPSKRCWRPTEAEIDRCRHALTEPAVPRRAPLAEAVVEMPLKARRSSERTVGGPAGSVTYTGGSLRS